MKQMYLMIILTVGVFMFASVENLGQQVLDSANVITTDNLDDNNLGTDAVPGTNLSGPNYKEYPSFLSEATISDGWWTNTIGHGGNHRRSTRQGSGNSVGSRAVFSFDVPVTDHYVVYHHMPFSGNSSPRVNVKFYRFGESEPVANFYYNERNNNLADSRGSWYPLGIVEVFSSDSALSVELGLDSTGQNVLRVDAVRILRSSQTGPDIEFGNRRSDQVTIDAGTGDTTWLSSFYHDGFSYNITTGERRTVPARAPFEFAQTMFKFNGYTDQVFPVFNLGSDPLVITEVRAGTSRFYSTSTFPMVIQPGEQKDVVIRFAPLGEEVTVDTLVFVSNDPLEPEAILAVSGEGINYNFIMNASNGGIEPHWNAPSGATYEELGEFLNSATSPFPYPITGGNVSSRVNVGSDPNIAVYYKFQLPDTLFGSYYIEYSGPAGSSNAAQNVTVDVVTPFYTNPDIALGDTQRVTNFNSRAIQSPAPIWARIGGSQVFTLNGGGETVVRFTNPNQGADLLRADLLRVRLVPLAPDISTSLDPARLLNFGSVSIFDSVRLGDFNYQRNFIIGSNGETPLVIDTIYLSVGQSFEVVNMPTFPLSLPSIDGQYNLIVNFLPDSIKLYPDTIFIASNDPNDSLITIVLSGQGVGTGITVDNADPSNFLFPADFVPAGTPIDNTNDFKWIEYTSSGAVNGTGFYTFIYRNPQDGLQKIEWFPNFPFNPNNPGVNEPDSFNVFVQIPVSSPNSSPAARYRIKHFNGETDTVISQLNRTLNGGKIPLGTYTFIRGGQDSPGSGTVFGSIELVNDTALVSAFFADSVSNMARDSAWVLRADAVILEEASDVTDVEELTVLPTAYSLSQNYPNPFNPTTQIRFALPQSGMVELKVYDVLGREVVTLINGEHNAGTYTVEWNGKNNYGAQVASGMYIYRIKSGNFVQTKKMMMLK